jgi:CubicO group peptidase (beta-lactamase class C family)
MTGLIGLLVAGVIPRPCGGPAAAPSQDGPSQRLERLVRAYADSGFNGNVLVSRDGAVVFSHWCGWADAAGRIAVTPETAFWIASISKQFAAAAVLRLAEQGRLSLTDTIGRFLAAVPADKRSITVHELLTHTAGLSQQYAADGIADRDAAVAAVLSQPLARAPGGEFGYSNDAYTLIAAIVEIAAGVPYEDYLTTQLLSPTGMRHTGFWGPGAHPEVAAILGSGPSGSAAQPNWGYRGAVGMFSTVEDLHRWYLALMANRVLTVESRERLLRPWVRRGETGVGYGWFTSRAAGQPTSVWTRGYEGFGHGAVLAAYPAEGVVIVVTTNSGERAPNVPVSHQLADDLAAALFGSGGSPPEGRQPPAP